MVRRLVTRPDNVGSYGEIDPDTPISSIEGTASPTPSSRSSTLREETPSVSITPPAQPTDEAPGVPRSSVSTIDGELRNLVLSATPDSTSDNQSQSYSLANSSSTSSQVNTPTTSRRPSPSFVFNSNTSSTFSFNATPSRSSPSLVFGSNTSSTFSFNATPSRSASNPDTPIPSARSTPRPSSTHLHPQSLSPSSSPSPRSPGRRRSRSSSQAAHDVAEETLPREPFYNPDFQRAISDTRDLLKDLAEVLASSDLHVQPESSISARYKQCRELVEWKSPETRVVGLVGDSGVGKSSVINSLLDRRGLARSSNEGEACTCVATEYHYHEATSFVVETDYFTHDDIKKQFTELLQDYRKYKLGADDMDEHEREDFKNRAERATYTFRAALGNHFARVERNLVSHTEQAALDELMELVRQHGPPLMEGSDGFQRTLTLEGLEECSNTLANLTSQVTQGHEPVLWPFIKKIKVFLNAHILRRGLILVDLPGLRDLNAARVFITERYMLNCDEIFAVCNMGRAASDAGVEAVFALAQRSHLSNVGIICTKSDDMRYDEVSRSLPRPERLRIDRLSAEIDACRERILQLQEEIDELEPEDDDDVLEEHEEAELRQCRRQLRSAKTELENKTFSRKQTCMLLRSSKVESQLRTMYGAQALNGNINVFCVSNTDYWTHRYEPRDQALRFLDLSNILCLRKHCISIVATSKLRAAVEYMTQSVPALLGSIQLWVDSGAGNVNAERKRQVREAVNQAERSLDEGISSPNSQIERLASLVTGTFREDINEIMNSRTASWRRSGKNAASEWNNWHHSSFSAFCRQYGTHCTQAAGSHCWNEEVMAAMVEELRTPWQALKGHINIIRNDSDRLIDDSFERAITIMGRLLRYADGTRNDAVCTLVRTISHRKNLLSSAVDLVFDEFNEKLAVLHTDALSGIRSSFMGQLMEGTYRATHLEFGTGSDRRRKLLIGQGYGDEALFDSLCSRFRRKFSELANELESKVQEAVRTHLNVIQQDLDVLRNENIALESELNNEFRERLGGALERLNERVGEVSQVVNSIA